MCVWERVYSIKLNFISAEVIGIGLLVFLLLELHKQAFKKEKVLILRKRAYDENPFMLPGLTKTQQILSLLLFWSCELRQSFHTLELSVQTVGWKKAKAIPFWTKESTKRNVYLLCLDSYIRLSALKNLYQEKNFYLMLRSSNNSLVNFWL